MIPAERHARETARLRALRAHEILDTAPEAVFDEITELAAAALNVPTVLVSLVDEHRQWFKSRCGLHIQETSRDVAFCAHAILEDDPLVVADALSDPRFWDNPLVTGDPNIRFYAGAPLIDKDGLALGTLCLIDNEPRVMTPHQIDVLKKLARQVVTQLELRQSSHLKFSQSFAKTEFLDMTSHEIRTSLHGIVAAAQLLDQSPLSEEQKDLVGTIRVSSNHLMHAISETLEFAQIESTVLALRPEPFDLQDLVLRTAALFTSTARAADISLSVEHSLTAPAIRIGDPMRIRQALIHLIGNAIKQAHGGTVTVRVEDNEQSLDVLFEVYDSISIQRTEGTAATPPVAETPNTVALDYGLGAARRMVAQMGGKVGASSTPAVGNRFWFSLPLEIGAAYSEESPAVQSAPQQRPIAGLRILLVDDDRITRTLVAKMIQHLGCQATLVQTGREAVEACLKRDFDVIFMDCQMPEMDGYEATRLIRLQDGHGRHVPIIALTASAIDSVREKCLLAGMSDFLTKPLVYASLESTLRRTVNAIGVEQLAPTTATAVQG
jgi:two-component system, sensor histidine kinase